MVVVPEQIVVLPVMTGAGAPLAVTETEALAVQPEAFVTVTEYEPAELTLIEEVVAPLLHRLPVDELEVRVVNRPGQKKVEPEMETIGSALMVNNVESEAGRQGPDAPSGSSDVSVSITEPAAMSAAEGTYLTPVVLTAELSKVPVPLEDQVAMVAAPPKVPFNR